MRESIGIQTFILKHAGEHPRDLVAFTMGALNISRTTALRHIRHLIKKKALFKSGTTKSVHYSLYDSLDRQATFNLTQPLDEFEIVKDNFSKILSHLNDNVREICEYGLTEIINNAIEHSQGKSLMIEITHENEDILLTVTDDGIGIFEKISLLLGASDNREAVLQLNKGKFTSDPANHTGEGIFFCSRLFDEFQLIANGLNFTRYNPEHDWFLKKIETKRGTSVKMKIASNSTQRINDTFNIFQDPESLQFNKTEIIVALSKFGYERYISRSQAKRILKNLEKFQIIVFDFKGIDTVGQGFVDEVFRVYQNNHPAIKLNYINANENVLFMIKRGIATANSLKK